MKPISEEEIKKEIEHRSKFRDLYNEEN